MSEKSAAYNAGVVNRNENKNGPNPYAEESADWYDFEHGWGETSNEEERVKWDR